MQFPLVRLLAAGILCLALTGCDGDGGIWVGWDGSVQGDGRTGDGPGPGSDGDGAKDGYKGSDAMQGCNPQSFTLKQSPPPEIYLVLDRSGSMLEKSSGGTQTKWQELYGAVDFVLTQFESTIHFGLLMYPSDSKCKTPGPQVAVAVKNRNAILYFLAKAIPAGGTPTAAALSNAAQSLSDLGDKSSTKYLILATDGGPNCNYLLSSSPSCSCTYASSTAYCCTSYPLACYSGETCLDDANSLAVVTNLYGNKKMKIFVVGLEGSGEYKKLLDAMAKAGGAPQTTGTTSYYKASNKTELESALKIIASSVISCEIDLGSAPKYPNYVKIYIDGKQIPRDTTKINGWDFSDSTLTKIKLYGAACKSLQDGKTHKLTATFACVAT